MLADLFYLCGCYFIAFFNMKEMSTRRGFVQTLMMCIMMAFVSRYRLFWAMTLHLA